MYLDEFEPVSPEGIAEAVRWARLMHLVATGLGVKGDGKRDLTLEDFLPMNLRAPKKVETPFERGMRIKAQMQLRRDALAQRRQRRTQEDTD